MLAKLNKQLTDASRWANKFRTDFGAYYTTQVPCHLDIVTADTVNAVTADVGATVTLSAQLRTQGGTAVTGETFKWSVKEPGATLSTTTGSSTVFSANAPGVYTVSLSDSKWPNLPDEELVFVGKWNPSGVREGTLKSGGRLSLGIARVPHGIVITSPFAGEVRIVTLQGRCVKSFAAGKTTPVVWNTRGTARGLYLLTVRNATQRVQGRFFIQ